MPAKLMTGWVILFYLTTRKLPLPVLRLLLHWYSEQEIRVCWESSLSRPFTVSNGVHQSGVLPPLLFTVYLNDLLVQLTKQGISCHWQNYFVGALAYADDVALLAPSPSAFCSMLKICNLLLRHKFLTLTKLSSYVSLGNGVLTILVSHFLDMNLSSQKAFLIWDICFLMI